MTTLYIKTHNTTGLKYFGKTIHTGDAFRRYRGSGVYWTKHIKQYGCLISTETYATYDESSLFGRLTLEAEALLFSEINDITESSEWANLQPENGLDGGLQLYGKDNPNYGNAWDDAQKKVASDRMLGTIVVRDKTTGRQFSTTLDNWREDENLEAESKGRILGVEQRKQRSTDSLGNKNVNARNITVFNENNEVMFVVCGSFRKLCKEHKLPYGPLCTIMNTGKTLYSKKKSTNEHYQQFKGWHVTSNKKEIK
jgi:hypothetical protein